MVEQNANNTSPLILHLHIPKTGGLTFVHSVLPAAVEPNSIFTFSPEEREPKLHQLASMPPDELAKYRAVTGHFYFGLHRRLSRPSSYVTFLRDPVAMYLSNYYYILTRPFHPQHKEMVSGFVTVEDYLVNTTPNVMARWIAGDPYEDEGDLLQAAKTNLQEHFSVVGITERFDEAVCLFELAFGFGPIAFETKNTSPFRPTQKGMSPSVVEKIKEANRVDVQLYEFGCELFDQQLGKYSKEQLGISLLQRAAHALNQSDTFKAFALAERAWNLCPDHEEFRKIRLVSLERVIAKMTEKNAL